MKNSLLLGEPAEEHRAEYRACQIGAAGKADINVAKAQKGTVFECAPERAGQRYLESVENPGDAKRNDGQCMETTPRQAIQSGRYIGFDNRPTGSRAPRAYCGLLFGTKCHDPAYQGGNAMHTAEKRAGVGKDEKEFPLASDVLIIWNLWRGDPNMGKFRRRHNFKNVRRGARELGRAMNIAAGHPARVPNGRKTDRLILENESPRAT